MTCPMTTPGGSAEVGGWGGGGQGPKFKCTKDGPDKIFPTVNSVVSSPVGQRHYHKQIPRSPAVVAGGAAVIGYQSPGVALPLKTVDPSRSPIPPMLGCALMAQYQSHRGGGVGGGGAPERALTDLCTGEQETQAVAHPLAPVHLSNPWVRVPFGGGGGGAQGLVGGGGFVGREGTSEVAPGAVRQAVGGGCHSRSGRLLSVTNAIEPGTCRLRDSGWA